MANELQSTDGPIFICNNSEQFGDGSPIYKLQTNRPTWWVQDDLPWMTHDELETVVQQALDAWAAVCNVKARKATSAAAANFLVTVAQMDGPGRVLADMQTPAPGLMQQRMRIDIAEQALKGLLKVILIHEFGHGFGLQHFSSSPPPEIMEATLNQAVQVPQPTESALMAQLFGLPLAPSPAGGVPVAPMVCTMRVEPGSSIVQCSLSVQQGDKKAELTGSKAW